MDGTTKDDRLLAATTSVNGADTMKNTTTISTIAVQSGKTRLVIALLHCGDWIQLKILEVTPELTTLGNTLSEALELQRAHDEVLRQLQNKQSPVEELLRQADQLIATQKPRAEVYAAMAESLGRAWKDVNTHLELRKQILDLNVLYHTKAQEFFDKHDALEASCKDTVIPVEIDAVKSFLTNIHELRRGLLENLMAALSTGNSLIAKLKELGAEGSLDSRPDRIRSSVSRAINQVQCWMDELHVKRQVLEATFIRRKTQLEQCLALAILAADLRELEEIVQNRRQILANTHQLGDSASSTEILYHEHKKLLPEAQQLQERAVKITKATDQLVASGCFAGQEAAEQSYNVLSTTSDYLSDLQQRDHLLERVIAFFRSAQSAINKLEQLEVQLATTELPSTSPQLAQLHAQCAKAIEEIIDAPLKEGHAILSLTGNRSGTEGVKRIVEEMENKKIYLNSLCTAHLEENRRINEALNAFLEKQNDLYTWLSTIAEAFLQSHQDMGSELHVAKDFLELHNHLLTDLQTKGNEVNALLLTLPPILEYLGDNQRKEVDSKVEALHERWLKLKNILEERLDLISVYVKFHMEADIVSKEMDNLERSIPKDTRNVSDDLMNQLEEKWSSLVPLYQSAKNTGITFINNSAKVSEPYLDTKRACLCVESVLDKLKNRQLNVTRTWETFQEDVTEKKEVLVLVEQNMVESTKTINWVTKLDAQLYPVITTDAIHPKDISSHIEHKLETVLPEIKRAQCEVEQRIKTAESLAAKAQGQMDEKSLNVKNKLTELNQKLVDITANYQILLQMMISYFKNLTELDKTIDNFNQSFNKVGLPKELGDLLVLLKEHDASKQAIVEMFRFTQNEADQIIARIQNQEPPQTAQHDIDKLRRILQIRRDNWEEQWRTRKDTLEAQKQLLQFDSDLGQINETLDDLSRQLGSVKGQYGETQASAKATSLAFQYFEKTVELLEQRINEFVKTGEALLDDQHVHSPHIERHIKNLQERWNDFKKQVYDTRRLIDLSIEYFHLVEEAEEWFREGSRLLISIARKSTLVKKPEEAQALLNEVEVFLKPGEAKQNERIQKISTLSKELFGQERSKQVSNVLVENKEMLDSFTVISNELNILARNLVLAEGEKEKLLKEQEEANAKLSAMKAEALAAQAAAAAAEEARKAAENAARALRESTLTIHKTQQVEILQQQQKQQIQEQLMEPPVFTVPMSDAIIEEGSKFTFMCHVTGNPLPVVTWHKDGISIQNNPDYQTTFHQGLCTLTIEETFAEDTAQYTCKAINAAGSAETTGTLSVKESQPEEQLIAPTFIKYLEPNVTREGSSFEFVCKVEGNPLPTVQWFKNAECIDNSPDYIITYNNGEAVLKFEHVFLDDRAEYTCKASNEVGTAQTTANLVVLPLEPAEAPVFITPLSNVMARAGQKIKLECEVSGLPPPNLSWSHNGKPVKETRELKLLREDTKATLVILEAFPKDAGTFVVTASNVAGQASTACSVSVKGRLPTETSDSELASDMEPVKPSIQLPLKDVSIQEGNRIRLDCVIVGQPEPEVIWYHDDRPVKESPDFQLLFQGDRCSLVIQEALPEDAGEYKVVALNSAGEASSKCKLTVTPVPAKEEEQKKVEVVPVEAVGFPPKFEKLLTDVLVSEGDKVILDCIVTGEPKPEVKWLLNNEQIKPSDHVKITQDEQGNITLTIDQVKPEDKGVYTVKASNKSGEAKCFSQLIVKSSRLPENKKEFEEVKTPPSFKEMFSDHNVFNGTSTKFECIVTGKPTPKVKWLFNNEPVSGKNFLVSTSGDRQVLSIPEVTHENQGQITCIAENEVGKATCSARLNVQTVCDVAVMPENNMQLQQQQQQIDQTDTSFSMKREVFMQSSSTTTKKMVTAGGGEPHVEMHSVIAQNQKSMQQVDQKPPEIKESHKIEEYHKVGDQAPIYHEKSASVHSGGVVQEQKSITIGAQQQQQQQQVQVQIQKPMVKTRPPKFMTPVVGKIVDQGVDVVLEGILDGSPTPQITWTKNGAELKQSPTVNISFEHNKTKLEIKNVNIQDAGRYTCTAINEAGTAVSTSDLVVRKTIFPPVFGHRLQAQVVKKGEKLIMEVEVTGTPDPVVTWHKEGQPITEVFKKNEYTLKSFGNTHTLTVEKAELNHTGKYMVRAVNDGGEAQSLADIAVYEPTPDTMVEVVKTVVFEDIRKHETLKSAAEESSKTSTVSVQPIIPTTQEIAVPKKIVESSVKTIDSASHQIEPIVTSDTQFSKQIITSDDGQMTQSITSKKETSTVVEKSFKHESKTFTMGAPPQLEPLEVIKRQTPVNVPQEVQQIQHQEQVEGGIQTESITKESSYNFFVKKMKESEQTPAQKEPPKPIELPRDSYTKFEDISQRFEKKDEIPIKLEPLPRFEGSTTKLESSFETSSSTYSQEFGLAPEPPPEICYAPKTENIKVREEVLERKKRLEEAHRDLSEREIPRGAVKIFPTPAPKVEIPILPSTFETSSTSTTFEKSVQKIDEPKIELPKLEPLPKLELNVEIPKQESVFQQQSSTSTSTSFKSVSAPRLAAVPKKEPIEVGHYFKPAEEDVMLPAKEFADIVQPTQTQTFKQHQYQHVEQRSGGPIFRPQAEIVTRPLSPRPAAEAVQMEKLWSQKNEYSSSTSKSTFEVSRPVSEISRPISEMSRPYSAASVSSVSRPISALSEPSTDAINMERTWAHKSTESHIQHVNKSWPPPPSSQESWSTQTTLEKKWTPSFVTKESKTTTTSFQASVPPPQPPQPIQHYVANVTKLHEEQYMQQQHSSFKEEVYKSDVSHVVEDKNVRPSEIIKNWPPKPPQHIEALSIRPVSVQDITDEVYLEPGTPPEIGYAQPPLEKKQPPPLPPKQVFNEAPPLPAKTFKPHPQPQPKFQPHPQPQPQPQSKPFERFPDLEPFPFKPDAGKPRPMKTGPPPTPSKFVKGKFVDSDYESEVESSRIPPKWKPFSSDTDEPSYRRVQPPRLTAPIRARSTEKEPLPPSKFEQPPPVQGQTRPSIDFQQAAKVFRREEMQTSSHQQVKRFTKHLPKSPPEARKIVIPELKPGSPPIFVQPKKPDSPPKIVAKQQQDGYMADTDDTPFKFQQQQKKFSHTKHEEVKQTSFQSFSSTQTQSQSQSQSTQKIYHTQQIQQQQQPSTVFQQQKRITTKKELVTPIISTSVTMSEVKKDLPALEPFPFKAEPSGPKPVKCPPPPSPSKFIKGEFRESDYESDYEARMSKNWSSDFDKTYKPVHPNLTPTGRPSSQGPRERTPTPPTEFDNPPKVGALRPKFEPIDKPKKTISVKLEEQKPKNIVFKPKPIPAKPVQLDGIIVATPAVPEPGIILQPGTPPEIHYAPGPGKITKYYRSTTSAPYHNAVQTETSNVVHFNEATETSRRHVSVQQTTKVIKFGGGANEQSSDLHHQQQVMTRTRRGSAPPPCKPTKFVPGEFRESDYESEVESARIKPKWVPGGSDTDEPRYKKVRAPASSRSSSVPAPNDRVLTPMEFDKGPAYTSTSSADHFRATSQKFGESSTTTTKSSSLVRKADQRISAKNTATKMASQHMDSMTKAFKTKTQQFVSDIMNDVNKKQTTTQQQKSICDGKGGGSDAQVYREESRAAQYGTKHVDPDTGLIYFKYDFGYEFGIVLPGESKNGEIPVPPKTVIEPPKRMHDIEMPVYHETSGGGSGGNKAPTPQFQPKKFAPSTKNVKWEPTSESEMSEYEESYRKKSSTKQGQQRWDSNRASYSPASTSPSLPSTSPAFNNFSSDMKRTETPPSCPSTPGNIANQQPAKRPPMFITPLRDIAVVSGQTARFECIVQSETTPNILWSKNSRILENSNNHELHYRNGVCRLTIPQAYPEDAGTYTCTASNAVGSTTTTATLQVPGERRSEYI